MSLPIFFFFVLLAVPTHQASELITQTCDKTSYKDLCNSALGSANAADVHSLAKSALEATTLQGGAVTKKIAELMMSKAADVVQKLTDCSERYNVAMDKIKFATAALEAKVFSDVNVGITTAMTETQSCEDGFKGASPMTADNTKFSQLCSISLSIAELAKN
ncbi:hypothetical protein P3X46_024957 [Hevea brasiliensis]|uniref:Pectinesterase inhibitor domain-containing protein n=1 Tax=Hevea brasiliensis TaxID=3981 RepID=A0ABQ9L7D4_HEVBR|nr:pectinesterase inhibitor-like [Hevea brasiliensis]KAJ9159449.1 hypothetical protein P3X46_024957 [Hevea brasiliensis]